MGRWRTTYEYTNKRKVFKTSYILCGLFNIFLLVTLWTTHYHNNELNYSKWIGGIIGTIQNTIIFTLVYIISNPWNLKALGMILLVFYIIYLILFGFLYKTK